MKKYGLIGYPLGHSFSIDYFNRKFREENIDARYVNFELQNISELKLILNENPDLNGLNVTLPYKVAVMNLLDDIDNDARRIGAVNVISIRKAAFGRIKLKGYNTDVIGFTKSIEALLKPSHRRALILGSGGSSKAVRYALKQLGVEPTIVSRTDRDFCIRYDEITPDTMSRYTVIVNCTPVGMHPNAQQCPNIPYDCITPDHLLYDLLYNPEETLFMQKGKARGATVTNGLEMLLLQAFASWEIWNRPG
ncbi:MAG: shikimate dehydrogenase [Tannerellaceae bacterium]|jgi:shikimate dehydrogenase|nr:shikimate dehydrogenase [Tannerellaceae bacterium]